MVVVVPPSGDFLVVVDLVVAGDFVVVVEGEREPKYVRKK